MATYTNPFNFIDPLLVNIPKNKRILCEMTNTAVDKNIPEKYPETYFNSSRVKPAQRWEYDNYFYRDLPTLNIKKKRADRSNIDVCMQSIHEEEKRKAIPSCSQSWYGHRMPNTVQYDETLGVHYGRTHAIKEFFRGYGMPWAKQEREQASNLLNMMKPENKMTKY